ncbi:hypothetical protein HHI36_011743 [Cryptolaemus montrouzieri]|uniref:P2X purinoreceptor 7 intracellular domain-containing protein n=1 Tax=Cryptolaemus montrouzieri TaxID=559131 RepID=A0ABD2NC29_9CUCU
MRRSECRAINSEGRVPQRVHRRWVANYNMMDQSSSSEVKEPQDDNCTFCHTLRNQCCCRSVDIRQLKGTLDCIVKHSSFSAVVLNSENLQVARYHMLRHFGEEEREKLIRLRPNHLWQYVAKEQFSSWLKVFSGNYFTPPPSCVLRKIEEEFPIDDNFSLRANMYQ